MASAAFFSAEVRGELLTLRVRDMPLKHVLEEIAWRSGIVVSIQGALEEPVTKVFDDLPIDRALRRLLKDKNHVFLYTRRDADDVTRYRLAEIRIYAGDLSPAQSSALNGGRMGIKEAPGREDPDGEKQAALDVLVSQALHEDEPRMRQKAVRLLGEHGGSADEVLDPLIQALDDTDNEVRK
ncbi:MAG: HEAT repeat domain-containing protein, partial [Gammaproteobacteria bacterium]